MKLISENSNVDVLVTSMDRFSKNILELTNIQKLCNMKKIRFFDVSARQYVFDILDNIKDNGTILLNTKLDKDKLITSLPNKVKYLLAKKNIKFYLIK